MCVCGRSFLFANMARPALGHAVGTLVSFLVIIPRDYVSIETRFSKEIS